MKITRTTLARGAFHLGIVALLGYLIFGIPRTLPATVALDGTSYRVTGPYTCENMSVFLIHADEQDARSFITLAEGLKQQVVRVTEKEQEQVNELQIENTGDDFLFLQEGDRVQGGKQDRTIFTSFVVPPHSGKLPLPAFCVEQSRWTPGAQGKNFGSTANACLAPKQVRCAAKVQKDQGQVWAEVQGQKAVAAMNAYAANTNSSLNETLDAPKVKQLSDRFAASLGKALNGKDDAVGVVIAVNGHIEEVNCFPNHRLLSLQYPRLIQSYALQASLEQKQKKGEALTAVAVCRFMEGAEQDGKAVAASPAPPAPAGQQAAANMAFQDNVQAPAANAGTGRRNEAINPDNRLEVVQSAEWYNCKTEFDGKLVHRQYLSRARPQQDVASPVSPQNQGDPNTQQIQQLPNGNNRPANRVNPPTPDDVNKQQQEPVPQRRGQN